MQATETDRVMWQYRWSDKRSMYGSQSSTRKLHGPSVFPDTPGWLLYVRYYRLIHLGWVATQLQYATNARESYRYVVGKCEFLVCYGRACQLQV